MLSDSMHRYLMQMIPLMLACISVICITLLCGNRWIVVAIELPIWALLFWWWQLQGAICEEEARVCRKSDIQKLREEQQQPFRKIY